MRPWVLVSTVLLPLSAYCSSPYNDTNTGITFEGFGWPGVGLKIGFALPQSPQLDFIGQVVTKLENQTGWVGISLGGGMLRHLLIVAWPNGNGVVSSFRTASEHTAPQVYSGDAKLTPINSGTFVNSTHISYTFLCSKCIMPANNFTFNPNSDSARIGYARSERKLPDTSLPSTPLNVHSEFGLDSITLASAKSAKYDTWAAMAGV